MIAELEPPSDPRTLPRASVASDRGEDVPKTRGGYLAQPRGGVRSTGLLLTFVVHLLIAAVFLWHWSLPSVARPSRALAVFNVTPPAPPPETPPDPVPAQKTPVTAKPAVVPDHPPPPIVAVPTQTSQPTSPAPVPVVTRAPEVKPPPPPPPPALSDAKPTWQGRVLAALNRAKRYPSDARSRGQQGVPYIRFVMDRSGMVLSSSLERSSGSRSLDVEAIALPRRAQPLPPPPPEVTGDTIELVVPVEFHIR